MPALQHAPYYGRLIVRSLRNEGLGFVKLAARAWRSVPGFINPGDARILYALAHHGPGHGAIVEIGSAWGKSTIFLASGSKRAGREKVYAIDPHTGDPWYLDALEQRGTEASGFSSQEGFEHNIHRFGLNDWVIPVVASSVDAARSLETGPIRLLFVDGLHTYEGVKADILDWVPRVIRGGIVVFDDYFSLDQSVGVRRAVDELLAAGVVASLSATYPGKEYGLLVTTRVAEAGGSETRPEAPSSYC